MKQLDQLKDVASQIPGKLKTGLNRATSEIGKHTPDKVKETLTKGTDAFKGKVNSLRNKGEDIDLTDAATDLTDTAESATDLTDTAESATDGVAEAAEAAKDELST